MTDDASSHRRILWATSVVGGATLGALVIGLFRNKAIALIGGPAGIGLFGLFLSVVSMAGSVATFGLNTSAVRELAQHRPNSEEGARSRRAIWTMAWPLALLGAAALWLTRDRVAGLAAASTAYAMAVGWLSIGVAATVLGECQLAFLYAYGRLGDQARVKLWGSAVAALAGIAAVYWLGVAGIVVAVISLPVMTALFAFWVGRDLPGSDWSRLGEERLNKHWRSLASIGGMVMVASATASLTQLGVRAIITHQLGLNSAGLFQAASAIMWVNLSLVLNAMAADYYPRISKVAEDRESISLILNQQLHVTLILAGPVLAATSLAAPFLLEILYSGEFTGSAFLLRLLIAAAVLRLPIWALGFVLVARRASGSYFLGELFAASAIPLTWALVPQIGLSGAGIAALVSALISISFYIRQVGGSHSVRVSNGNVKLTVSLLAFLCAVAVAFELSQPAGYLVGMVGAAAITWHSYRHLRRAVFS